MPHNHLNEIALGISALNVPFVKRDTWNNEIISEKSGQLFAQWWFGSI